MVGQVPQGASAGTGMVMSPYPYVSLLTHNRSHQTSAGKFAIPSLKRETEWELGRLLPEGIRSIGESSPSSDFTASPYIPHFTLPSSLVHQHPNSSSDQGFLQWWGQDGAGLPAGATDCVDLHTVGVSILTKALLPWGTEVKAGLIMCDVELALAKWDNPPVLTLWGMK